ncbi:MAG: alpha-L-fucosidase [Clostridia bacterium]|nr:alpha-L-fucosidase [Clostridia bacterium]
MMDNKQWFREAGYGMMIHWGLYALIGGEWKGRRMEGIGEWAQQYFRIPCAEYEQLARAFNPVLFDAEEWVKLAKDSGMKYMVVTPKHHDGFCLFHTKVDKWNVVDATPFGRDVIAELAEACYKHGLKLGLYYSQELDWHERNGGGWTRGKTWGGDKAYWVNNWDFPEDDKKDFSQCFEDKIKPQVKEILTGYGDLCLIWFDTPHTISPEQSRELYDLVKHYQPNCLVNSRIGNGMGDYHSTGDNQISYNAANPDAELYECPATLNDTWGYKAFDQNWKNPARVKEIRDSLLERGINYLLNVGPDALGRIPGPAADILRAAAPEKQ